MELFKNKRCPRCNTKVPKEINICPTCQLNYDKFNNATNSEAKVAIHMDERERVLYRRGCPSDVSKVKLLLLTIFLGFTGAHHYYVGRTGKGIFYSIFFVIGVVNAILTTVLQSTPHGELWEIFTLLVLVWGVVIMMWLIDIADVILNRYKIPVSLPKK